MHKLTYKNFKTKHLQLRQLSEKDAPAIFAMRSDAANNLYVDRTPDESLSDSHAFIHKINQGVNDGKWFYWGLALDGSNAVIGTICLWKFSEDRLTAEIGFELLPDFQGKGLMQEALKEVLDFGYNDLGLQSIEGFVHPDNMKSIALMTRSGFRLKIPDAVNVSSETENGMMLTYAKEK